MTAAASSAAPRRARRKTRGAHIGPDWRNGLFIVPFLIVYLGMLIYPLFWGMWISLQEYDMFDQSATFAGLVNFKRLFADAIFLGTVRNTFVFVLMTVPAFVVIGLAAGAGAQSRRAHRRDASRGVLRRFGSFRHDRHHHLEDHVSAGDRPDLAYPRPVRHRADSISDQLGSRASRDRRNHGLVDHRPADDAVSGGAAANSRRTLRSGGARQCEPVALALVDHAAFDQAHPGRRRHLRDRRAVSACSARRCC